MIALRLCLYHGDCLERLRELEDESLDACITDPPYDLTARNSKSGGFMGKSWDATGIAFNVEFWELVRRKMQPGGIVKAFGGTRTYHRMVRAVRAAGFVDVKLHAYVFGSGFPKSTNLSKQIDRMAKATRQVVGYKRGVGGENLGDVLAGKDPRIHKAAGGSLGAYGTGIKQIPVQVPVTVPATELAQIWSGYGTALKPAWESIVCARNPA